MAMGIAFIGSLCATPAAIWFAHKIGAIDIPKDDRRVHSKPIPRMGGLAIFVGFTIAFLLLSEMPMPKMLGILGGSITIIICGMIDDTRGVSPKQKLALQFVAAGILYYSGVKISYFANPFNPRELVDVGMMGLPITLIWVVGITNTVNLIDGLDGLAAGVSAISALTLAYIAFYNGRYETALLTLALAGACLGFLPYNFNPAKVFMGDTGSLFLGFILSAIAIQGSLKSAAIITTVIPVIALGLPIFDTTFAIMRRLLNGRPIMEADKGHLHHRLLALGLCQKRAVLTLYLISILLGISAGLYINKLYLYGTLSILATATLIIIPINRTLNRIEREEVDMEVAMVRVGAPLDVDDTDFGPDEHHGYANDEETEASINEKN